MQWPPQRLADDIDVDALRREIVAALADYSDLGRSIPASEWAVLNQRLLDFFDEKSVGAFERKKIEITIRQNVAAGDYSLFGSGKHLKNYVAERVTLDDAVAAVLEQVVRR
ncbi:MAG TPA: hypothetical protein VJ724_08360 [Tahibacter sp.]|nr:hypothetical protein [Tahibacter sp.]